jgi:cytochrome P450
VSNVTDAIQLVSFDEDSSYQDPAGFFARLRESRPVAPVRMPNYERAWVITRYADVRAALTDPRWRPVSLMNGLECLPVRLA